METLRRSCLWRRSRCQRRRPDTSQGDFDLDVGPGQHRHHHCDRSLRRRPTTLLLHLHLANADGVIHGAGVGVHERGLRSRSDLEPPSTRCTTPSPSPLTVNPAARIRWTDVTKLLTGPIAKRRAGTTFNVNIKYTLPRRRHHRHSIRGGRPGDSSTRTVPGDTSMTRHRR